MNAGFAIGNLKLNNPFLLAPLAGFTDKTMRALCAEQGASLTFTEMVSAKGLKYGDRKTRKLLDLKDSELIRYCEDLKCIGAESRIGGDGEDRPASHRQRRTGYQIFGSEPPILMEAAEELAKCDNGVLDLNCGCPVPKIVNNGEGSALLRNIDLLYQCVSAMVTGARKGAGTDSGRNTLPKPVTAKIRMGYELGENLAVEAAKAIEAAGAAAITVHGRTRQQFYEGKADWQVIADVKKAVSIPVIGNGDIYCGQDAIRMMDETGCDAVMIARGALGNPWIFREAIALWEGDCLSESPTDHERIDMLIRHIEMVCADKGERIGVKEMRKFVGHYTRGMQGANAVRRQVNNIEDAKAMIELLQKLKK
ncbi:MAG: tRNA-dihydrouridine synthase [Eubacteriales bacterium]|nr:tRNA-dihydrouridine synthase [Eubacteriales bacterium]